MKITLLTMGKTDVTWVRQGLELYVTRLKHYIPFSMIELPELKNAGSLTKEQIKVKEGHLIADILKPSDCLLYTSPSPRDRTRSRMPSSA